MDALTLTILLVLFGGWFIIFPRVAFSTVGAALRGLINLAGDCLALLLAWI